MKNNEHDFSVIELFAGVGGFRLGLEGLNKEHGWNVIWSNQWEPFKKQQHASDCYIKRFGKDGHSNEDIAAVKSKAPKKPTLLVGGFPCQDYSVAATKAKGIQGKKGVLWWEINEIIRNKKPHFILLENVDRLLRSPSFQRGRDFGIILSCLQNHGYHVEWRMINAADYGFPQRRRRTFIFGTKDKATVKKLYHKKQPPDIIERHGFFASEFPIKPLDEQQKARIYLTKKEIDSDIRKVSNSFEHHFFNSGLIHEGDIYTTKVTPISSGPKTLGDIILDKVHDKYYINLKDLPKWKKHKGAKKDERISKSGFKYKYSEGAIPFPDRLDSPSRTMLTAEGNKNPNRISHVIKDKRGHRILTPEEAEILNGFPAGWTEGMPERWRYFCMGNALVVGLIERMGKRLRTLIMSSK